MTKGNTHNDKVIKVGMRRTREVSKGLSKLKTSDKGRGHKENFEALDEKQHRCIAHIVSNLKQMTTYIGLGCRRLAA